MPSIALRAADGAVSAREVYSKPILSQITAFQAEWVAADGVSREIFSIGDPFNY
ncbi:MAG: hypothetical protein AVDCRST_MAG18-3363 [uncultured Thermomicrobiales bacterium]|uniref:Uncharacterized protein n=1 Tax=uncultured Thermomicrobiales bacterium TaxID=1645740 RepID=A0A6J4VMP2_9BACT|nr:MAG: hypothetical protein AVDCRST_MAG18-3363 [uncultured Thermomicrobiales bacterium]